jgi:trk system potassium uptake protein TrkA
MTKERVCAIFGLGMFGFEVCKELISKGGSVIAIDKNPEVIEKVKDVATQALLIDSTDEESLKNLALENIDVAIVAIGVNIEANILTTALLKKLGVPYIVARAITDTHARVLKQVGATEVVNIEVEEGKRVAGRVLSPNILDRIPISKGQTLVEMIVPKAFVNKTVVSCEFRKKYNVNVISIRRPRIEIDEMGNPLREEEVLSPGLEEVFQPNDVLVLVGSEEAIDALKEI